MPPAWRLPDAYHRLGWSAQAGGSLLGVMILSQGCRRAADAAAGARCRSPSAADCRLLCQLAGMSGFLLRHCWRRGWAAIAGFGLGAAFPLAMVLALDQPRRQARGWWLSCRAQDSSSPAACRFCRSVAGAHPQLCQRMADAGRRDAGADRTQSAFSSAQLCARAFAAAR